MKALTASELRLGNWINNGMLDKIEQCSIGELLAMSQCEIAGKTLPIEGIPLTEDWLRRFRFEQHPRQTERWFWNVNGWHMIYDEEAENWDVCPFVAVEGPQLTIGKSIKYVHQLQNLFFALTGTELELQPPK